MILFCTCSYGFSLLANPGDICLVFRHIFQRTRVNLNRSTDSSSGFYIKLPRQISVFAISDKNCLQNYPSQVLTLLKSTRYHDFFFHFSHHQPEGWGCQSYCISISVASWQLHWLCAGFVCQITEYQVEEIFVSVSFDQNCFNLTRQSQIYKMIMYCPGQ